MNLEDRTSRVGVTVLFSGRVQGVGFRFAVLDTASRFEVTGYVRNREDGSVEMVAEGSREALEECLQAVRSSAVGRFIVSEEAVWGPATGRYPTFAIRT